MSCWYGTGRLVRTLDLHARLNSEKKFQYKLKSVYKDSAMVYGRMSKFDNLSVYKQICDIISVSNKSLACSNELSRKHIPISASVLNGVAVDGGLSKINVMAS